MFGDESISDDRNLYGVGTQLAIIINSKSFFASISDPKMLVFSNFFPKEAQPNFLTGDIRKKISSFE